MRMGRNEVIEFFHLVTFERVQNYLALAGIAGVDQNRLARRRNDQDRVAFDGTDVEHMHLQLAGWFGWPRAQPGQAPFIKRAAGRAQNQHEQQNDTATSTRRTLQRSCSRGITLAGISRSSLLATMRTFASTSCCPREKARRILSVSTTRQIVSWPMASSTARNRR